MYTDDRLIEYFEIFLFDCFVDVVNNVLLAAETVSQHIIIDTIVNVMTMLNGTAGKARMVAGKTNFHIPVIHEIDAGLDADMLNGIL